MGASRANKSKILPPPPRPGTYRTGILCLAALLLAVVPHDAKLATGRLAGEWGPGAQLTISISAIYVLSPPVSAQNCKYVYDD
jgi:hypothetical protein